MSSSNGGEESIGAKAESHPDPRWVAAERVHGGIVVGILGFVSFLGTIFPAIFGTGLPMPVRVMLPLLSFSFVAGLGSFLMWWPAVRYRYTFYAASNEGIRIRRGVLWRTVSSVPRSRVQHTDVSRGPIERQLGLATLIIYTAGTEHAAVRLPGLTHETALAIRDHLIQGGRGDAVV